MLIVAVVFDFAPGGFERIKEEIHDAIENSRKEEGAQIYDWALDVTAPVAGLKVHSLDPG